MQCSSVCVVMNALGVRNSMCVFSLEMSRAPASVSSRPFHRVGAIH